MAKKTGKVADQPTFPPLTSALQIEFWAALQQMRNKFLSPAISQTVARLSVVEIDAELARYVKPKSLTLLASFGLRGEIVFPVPHVLKAQPQLLGYYRLLYGISQKEFYKGPFGRFRTMEADNQITSATENLLPQLCDSLCFTGSELLAGTQPLTIQSIHELQMLTIGPQLRGSQNNRIGSAATRDVFNLVKSLVQNYLESSTESFLSIKNAAGRIVQIAFAPDPDITIIETLRSGAMPKTSIEIKGGGDVSNVHNRIGEAEKSHLKAKEAGFSRFWTIVKARISPEAAHQQSPTTTEFFELDEILDRSSKPHARFRDLLHQAIGIS